MVSYKLKNGRIVQILDNRDLFNLIREELGDEIANKIEDDYDTNGEYQQAIEEDCERELSIKDDKIEELEDTIESLQEEVNELKGENNVEENRVWFNLFKTIIEKNDYYENMRKAIKRDEGFSLGDLVSDYTENAPFISVYYYLDSIEDWLSDHKNKKVNDALKDLWETGNWKE